MIVLSPSFRQHRIKLCSYLGACNLPLNGHKLATAFALVLMILTTPAVLAQSNTQTANTSNQLQDRILQAQEYLRDNPISPPDTTSPRATLESFLFVMREVSRLWSDVRGEYENGKRLFLTDDQQDTLVMIQALLEKAAQTLDLDSIPVTSRERAGIELVLQLQEILDRIPMPDISDIPGEPAGRFMPISNTTDLPIQWTLPSTSLSIIRQETGELRGHYLFSEASVNRIPEDYAVVRTLPLETDRGEDLFEYYIYTPGNLIAPRWYEIVKSGPNWLHYQFADQAYWQWLALFFLIGLYSSSIGIYIRWQRGRKVLNNGHSRIVRSVINSAILIGSTAIFRYLCEDHINITGTPVILIGSVTTAIIWSATSWLVYQILQLVYVWFIQGPSSAQEGLDASLLRTGFQVISLAIALIVLGYGATQIGIPIYGVIAGLGVGGLAIALAAQPTIENLIGGIILYADRMVRVGEFCEFDDLSGTIESIGIRSTRIRSRDRTLITIANADLAKRKIINFSQRDNFQFEHKFGLRYETKPTALKNILKDIDNYMNAQSYILHDTIRVRLIGFDDFAVTIEADGNVSATSYDDFLEIQEQMLFDIRAIIENNGSDFAYPSSTVYLSRDSGLQDKNTDGENEHSAAGDVNAV